MYLSSGGGVPDVDLHLVCCAWCSFTCPSPWRGMARRDLEEEDKDQTSWIALFFEVVGATHGLLGAQRRGGLDDEGGEMVNVWNTACWTGRSELGSSPRPCRSWSPPPSKPTPGSACLRGGKEVRRKKRGSPRRVLGSSLWKPGGLWGLWDGAGLSLAPKDRPEQDEESFGGIECSTATMTLGLPVEVGGNVWGGPRLLEKIRECRIDAEDLEKNIQDDMMTG